MISDVIARENRKTERRPWWRDWLAWVLLASAAFSLLSLVNLGSDVGRPYPGFLTYHNFTIGRLDVVRNAPAWWWQAESSPGITDVLKSVNSTPFDNLPTPLREGPIYESAWRAGQRHVEVVVEREGRLHTLQTPLRLFSWADYWDFIFSSTIIAAGLWLLAFILYRAGGSKPSQRLSILLLATISFLPLSNHPALFQLDQPLDRILSYENPVTAFSSALVGIMLLHLAFLFPYPLRRSRTTLGRRLFGALYFLPILTTLLMLASRVVIANEGISHSAKVLDEIAYKLMIGQLLAGALVLAGRLVIEAFNKRNRHHHRREAQLFLIGFVAMTPVMWLVVHPLFGDAEDILFLSVLADSRFYILAFAFAIASINLRYQTFRGAEKWLLFTLLFTVSGYLANVGAALVLMSNPQSARQFSIPPTVILFVLLLGASLLWSWQTSWQGWLGRVLNWEQVNYHAVQFFNQRVLAAPSAELPQLAKTIVSALHDILDVTWVAIWQPHEELLQPTAAAGTLTIEALPALAAPAAPPTVPVRVDTDSTSWPNTIPPGAAAALPLVTAGELLGLVIVGQREDETVFDDRDLEILALIAQQATIFLKNGQQSVELRRRDQEMVNLQTETQQKIAQDLHDYVLPVMSRLQLQMLTGVRLLPDEPGKAVLEIQNSIDDARRSAALIRRLQKQLVLPPLEYSLTAYLQELAEKLQQETSVTVDCEWPGDLDKKLTDLDVREAIYAVWRQAFDNILQHADASHVNATLTLSESAISFTIADDGCGCSAAQRQEALRAGRFGLRSMRMRLEAVGGRFKFISHAGKGSAIHGVIPRG